jgi:hypothetical protein
MIIFEIIIVIMIIIIIIITIIMIIIIIINVNTGNATNVNRRMLGHGNLAERALRPVIPDFINFPYSIR